MPTPMAAGVVIDLMLSATPLASSAILLAVPAMPWICLVSLRSWTPSIIATIRKTIRTTDSMMIKMYSGVSIGLL